MRGRILTYNQAANLFYGRHSRNHVRAYVLDRQRAREDLKKFREHGGRNYFFACSHSAIRNLGRTQLCAICGDYVE